MSTTGHYLFNDIYAKIIFMQQGNERTFEQIKSIWRFLNCDVVIHKEVELNKITRAVITLDIEKLFQMINEVEFYNTIDEIEVKDIYIINDLIKSIENLPNQKDWRGITANGYKEPKNPKYNSIKESVINEFKTYLIEQKDIIEQPQQKDEKDITKYLWFKIGLSFATGEMEKYYYLSEKNEKVFKEGYTPSKIAKELNNKGFEKYILASINNYKVNNTDKNIFYDAKKMKQIIDYCTKNNIDVIDSFTSYYKSIESN